VSSAPFYERLTTYVQQRHLPLHLIAVAPESTEESKSFLKDKNITVDRVDRATLSDLGIDGTPTLLLVAKNGTVTHEWVGLLSDKAQDEVLATIKK
jgi:hypothetical protein